MHRKMAYFSSLVRKPFSFILCKGACTWFQITWFSELAENIKIDISKHYIPESSKGCPNLILLMSFLILEHCVLAQNGSRSVAFENLVIGLGLHFPAKLSIPLYPYSNSDFCISPILHIQNLLNLAKNNV